MFFEKRNLAQIRTKEERIAVQQVQEFNKIKNRLSILKINSDCSFNEKVTNFDKSSLDKTSINTS